MRNKKYLTFEKWMQYVNWFLHDVTTDDLPDCCYRDWYDSGMEAKVAAKKAMRNAMDF